MRTWAVVDQNNVVVDVFASDTPIPGLVEIPEYIGIGMDINTPPPAGWKSQTQIAQEDADTDAEVRDDAQVRQFIGMTPAQVSAYIDANVTNVATARTMIKFLARMLLLLARRSYR